jgi:hypothetical protein
VSGTLNDCVYMAGLLRQTGWNDLGAGASIPINRPFGRLISEIGDQIVP